MQVYVNTISLQLLTLHVHSNLSLLLGCSESVVKLSAELTMLTFFDHANKDRDLFLFIWLHLTIKSFLS